MPLSGESFTHQSPKFPAKPWMMTWITLTDPWQGANPANTPTPDSNCPRGGRFVPGPCSEPKAEIRTCPLFGFQRKALPRGYQGAAPVQPGVHTWLTNGETLAHCSQTSPPKPCRAFQITQFKECFIYSIRGNYFNCTAQQTEVTPAFRISPWPHKVIHTARNNVFLIITASFSPQNNFVWKIPVRRESNCSH